MDAYREYLNKPLAVGIAGFIFGLIIGWLVIGWWLWPVEWTDAAASHLRSDLQEEWLRMAIDSYNQNQDPVRARQRWEELGPEAPAVLAAIQTDPGTQDPAVIAAFRDVALAGLPPVGEVTPGLETPTAVAATPPVGGSLVRTILPIMCGLTLLLAAALVAVFLLRSRGAATVAPTPAPEQQATEESEWTEYAAVGEEAPMAQFMASYRLGDDLFDESFSIDSPAGEFLGECGVGISETIGVGEPKKVTAFEVWLFDKNDIQTVTKVLMSTHAFEDEVIRQRLAAKGEPVLANPGNQVVLETATLQLVARVVDMSYGEGALPTQSFFDSLVLDLAVWPK